MPILSVQFKAQIDPGSVLAREGPGIPVVLQVPTKLEEPLKRENKPIPAPLSGRGLIDTGATMSMVDEDAISHLCVSAVGTINLTTPSGQCVAPLYPIRLTVVVQPHPPLVAAELASIPAGPLKQQGLLCLIGRDVLRHAMLVYEGGAGHIAIAF